VLRRSVRPVPRFAAIIASSGAALLLLSACAPGPEASPSPQASPSAVTTEAAAPALLPEGTADDNLPFFRSVAESVWATEQRGEGRAYIDALVVAGFARADMQVTQDQTTVGNPVESLQFSVRWGEESCLVGQVGPSTGQVVAAVMPQLAEGRCLVGATRAIDW
jgi:hypothetical protein